MSEFGVTPFIIITVVVRFALMLAVPIGGFFLIYYYLIRPMNGSTAPAPENASAAVSQSSPRGALQSLYLYGICFVMLIAVVFSGADLVSAVLKSTIFREADTSYYAGYPDLMRCDDTMLAAQPGVSKEACEKRLAYEKKSRETSRLSSLHGSFAQDIAFLVITLPVFLYYIRLARAKS